MIPAQLDARHYIRLSIAAALGTIALKLAAWQVSGSVGLLSDALESFVNLAGAAFAMRMIQIARTPADQNHPFGHGKAEYFSSGFEGTLIFIAALAILWSAVPRLIAPEPLEAVGLGLWLSAASAVLNFIVSRTLAGAARRLHSVALDADARHLMTDVWTSIGVIGGLIAVQLTGWLWLDAVIAIGVALHILLEGARLMRGATDGLMDLALPDDEVARIEAALAPFRARGIVFDALRTRRAGDQRFVHCIVRVPGDWRVDLAHALLDEIEAAVANSLHQAEVTTHLEPLGNDPMKGRNSPTARAAERIG